MEEIMINLKDVRVASVVLALMTIFLLGCLKLIPPLKNLKADWKKAVYQVLNLVIAGVLSVLYHLFITKGTWNTDMLSFATVVAAQVNILYPLYENLGLRALVRKIFSLLAPSKVKETDQAKENISTLLPTSAQVLEKQEKSKKTGWLE